MSGWILKISYAIYVPVYIFVTEKKSKVVLIMYCTCRNKN